MKITITGRDIQVTEAIKGYIEEKSDRVQKYFEENAVELYVTIKKEGENQVAEMQLTAGSDIIRAVTGDRDLYASIDKDIDILEGQIRKLKTKKAKLNMTDSIKAKEEMRSASSEIENEIIKHKQYSIKPMGVEDARLLLASNSADRFLVFINIDTKKVNVIYRLNDDKNYGLIEPEA